MTAQALQQDNNVHAFPVQPAAKSLTEQLGLKVDASLDTQIMTARAFPRDVKQCMVGILDLATMDQDMAASCYYTLPRAGKSITGPSIRLAEICASFWGNMQAGTEVISNDGKVIIVRGWCWDLQTNLKISSEVTKSIRDRSGKVYSADMQATTAAAASAIALRNAIFKIVPQIFVEKAYKKAMEIAVNGVPENSSKPVTFENRRQEIFERIQRLGVRQDDILQFFSKPSLEQITVENLSEIIGIGTSIKDGYIKAEHAFKPQSTRAAEIADLISDEGMEEGEIA